MLPSRTADFIANGAPKGARNEELFSAACQLRDTGSGVAEALSLLGPGALSSGLSPAEVHTTVHSAFTRGARDMAKATTFRPIRIQRKVSSPLPPPLSNPIEQMFDAAFSEGERVRVCKANAGDGRPAGAGELMDCGELLELSDKLMTEAGGMFIAINPLDGGIKDADVTTFRHCLVEFDDEPLETQWALIEQSRLPVSAVIYSGGKSVHAWVRVDAVTRAEYDERVDIIYDYFSGYNLDTKNRNPSRLSRLPGALRHGRAQDLLAVKIGLPAWSDWIEHMECLSIGPTMRLSQLRGYLEKGDATSLLGDRWLCSGGSCVLSGPSGVGKSSLAMQMAMMWAVGKPAFGIEPKRPLKSLIIQAENDRGDLSEQVTGVEAGLELDEPELLDENLSIIHCTAYSGEKFIEMLGKLIARRKPDLCWIDPLFSYVGGDVCSQEVCSKFLREGLNPISAQTGVTWMIVHHTTKPKEQDFGSQWQAYDMFGSSELVNWARAVCVLKPCNGNFALYLAKRGKRAIDGREQILLRHSLEGVCWEELGKEVLYCE